MHLTDVLLGGLFSRDLTNCPDSYSAADGLSFTTQCGQNINCTGAAGCDFVYWFNINKIQDCMNLCSASHPGCKGLTYSPVDGVCVIKNSVITQSMFQSNSSLFSALANTAQLAATASTTCPHQNGTTFNTTSGMLMTMQCGVDFTTGEYEFPNIVYGPHADTLDECVGYCADAHPLCRGVTWNPDMENGYANCYLKNDSSSSLYTPSGYVVHSAKLVSSDTSVNPMVPSNNSYISGQSTFTITQDFGRANTTNITSIHAANVGPCLDACAQSNASCVGVVMDLTVASGYHNCYLLNDTGVAQAGTSTIYAALTTSTSSSGASTSSPSSSGGSSSQAWIAGAVIGPLALIAIIIGAVIWYRRKRRVSSAVEATPMMKTEQSDEGAPYRDYNKPELDSHAVERSELDGQAAPVMLHGKEARHELSSQAAPVELPATYKH